MHLARFDGLDDVPQRLRSPGRLGTAHEAEGRGRGDTGRGPPGQGDRILARGRHCPAVERRARGRPRRDGNARAAGLADLFIVSEIVEGADAASGEGWRESQAYAGVQLAFRKARGRRCDRCWKVTPEAEATGLCDRCRAVLGGRS